MCRGTIVTKTRCLLARVLARSAMMVSSAATLVRWNALAHLGQAAEPQRRRGRQGVNLAWSRWKASAICWLPALAARFAARDRMFIRVACRFTVFFTVNGLPRNGGPFWNQRSWAITVLCASRALEISDG